MNKSYLESMPDINGFFGKFGGSFIPPILEKPFADILASDEKEPDTTITNGIRHKSAITVQNTYAIICNAATSFPIFMFVVPIQRLNTNFISNFIFHMLLIKKEDFLYLVV